MKTLILTTVLSFVTFTSAAPGGVHGGTVVSGPSGIVTNHGAIGPAALGLGGLGGYGGHGGGAYVAGPVGPSAFITGPAVSHASVIGPAAGFGGHGFGAGGGLGGFGGFGALAGLGGLGGHGGYGGYSGYSGYQSGLGLFPGVTVTNGGGTIGLGHHGVTVKGPATVPVTIAGPAGKVVADGLYGVPTHGHGW
ncbi:hypothetical protein NQ314_016866 [Rhamnusium bicolor]|uniref:Uncharacterized protein n=1 Tax=Rhamnusium bicolor TaxID=1586634 RepID=A0AAV8WUQ6_9CUCU|nr:hypothetical protein NQ314_016866 [Rhamnusium bicolor]